MQHLGAKVPRAEWRFMRCERAREAIASMSSATPGCSSSASATSTASAASAAAAAAAPAAAEHEDAAAAAGCCCCGGASLRRCHRACSAGGACTRASAQLASDSSESAKRSAFSTWGCAKPVSIAISFCLRIWNYASGRVHDRRGGLHLEDFEHLRLRSRPCKTAGTRASVFPFPCYPLPNE